MNKMHSSFQSLLIRSQLLFDRVFIIAFFSVKMVTVELLSLKLTDNRRWESCANLVCRPLFVYFNGFYCHRALVDFASAVRYSGNVCFKQRDRAETEHGKVKCWAGSDEHTAIGLLFASIPQEIYAHKTWLRTKETGKKAVKIYIKTGCVITT